MTRNYEKLGWTDRNLISANFHFNYLFHENLFGNSASQVRPLVLPAHRYRPPPPHGSPCAWPEPSSDPCSCVYGTLTLAWQVALPCVALLTSHVLVLHQRGTVTSPCPPWRSVCVSHAHQMSVTQRRPDGVGRWRRK